MKREIEFTEAEIELLDDLIGRALTRQGIAQRYRGHEAVVYSITDKVTHAKGPDPIGRTSRQRLSDLRASEPRPQRVTVAIGRLSAAGRATYWPWNSRKVSRSWHAHQLDGQLGPVSRH